MMYVKGHEFWHKYRVVVVYRMSNIHETYKQRFLLGKGCLKFQHHIMKCQNGLQIKNDYMFVEIVESNLFLKTSSFRLSRM